MSGTRRKRAPSLATTLEGLSLDLGPTDAKTGKRTITRDGVLWFRGTAHEVSALLLAAPALVVACRSALERIESDIETPGHTSPEGRLLRAVIARVTGGES